MSSVSRASRWLVPILLSGGVIALAFVLLFLRERPSASAVAGGLGAAPRELVALVPPESEGADEPPPPTLAGEGPAPGARPEPPDLESEDRESVQPEPRRSRALAAVKGRLVPAVWGAQILIGSAGVLPLDSAAASWPAGLDDEPGRPVQVLRAGPDGSFASSGLEPGRLRLAVRAEGCAPIDRDDLWLLPGEELDLGGIALTPGPFLVGSVVDPLGSPVLEAELYLLGDRVGGPWRALGPDAASPLGRVSGTDGTFGPHGCALGAVRLLVAAPGRPTAVFEGFVRAGGAGLGRLRFTLEESQALSGEVIDVDGVVQPGHLIGAASLRVPLVAFEDARAAGVPPQALAGWRTTHTDETRRFQLAGLAAGETVALRLLGGEPFDVPDAFAPAELATAGSSNVELSWRASSRLSFEVVDAATSAGLEGWLARLPDVSPRVPLGRRGASSAASWSDLRPFTAALDPLFADLPESPDLRLSVEAEGCDLLESPPFRLRSGDTIELGRLALFPLPAVHVRVLDAWTGKPLAGAECALLAVAPEFALGREESRARSGRDGRARLTQLAGNAADLFVQSAGHAPWRGRAPAPNLAQAPFEVRLTPGARLRVRVLDDDRRAVRAEVLRRRSEAEIGSSLEGGYERVLVDADGWAEFTELEAGMASVAARELPRADLDLPADPAGMTWVAAGLAPGGRAELEVPAARVLDYRVRLALRGRPLAHALVRLAPGREGFSRPHADAMRLAATVASRCDERGLCTLTGLPAGYYSLRIEHPELSGFARAVVIVEPRSRYCEVDLGDTSISGVVLDEDGEPVNARLVLSAHQGAWYEGIEIEQGASLHSIAPPPIVLATLFSGSEGFVLEGLPPGVELVLGATSAEQVGDYFVEPLEQGEKREGVFLNVSRSTSLRARARSERRASPPALGVIALCLDQPWGRGVVACALEGFDLQLPHRPQGRWRLRLVELAGGHIVLRAGPWSEVESLRFPVSLSFSDRER